MSEEASPEIIQLEQAALGMKRTADQVKALAIAQGVYGEEMKASVEYQHEYADEALRIAAWARENNI